MSAIEDAARRLVAAGADEKKADEAVEASVDALSCEAAIKETILARGRYYQAWEDLARAVAEETPERTVKRPSITTDEKVADKRRREAR